MPGLGIPLVEDSALGQEQVGPAVLVEVYHCRPASGHLEHVRGPVAGGVASVEVAEADACGLSLVLERDLDISHRVGGDGARVAGEPFGQGECFEVDAGDGVGRGEGADWFECFDERCQPPGHLVGPGLRPGLFGPLLLGPDRPAVGFPDQPQFVGELGHDLQFTEPFRGPERVDAGDVAIEPPGPLKKWPGVLFAAELDQDESELVVGLVVVGIVRDRFPEAAGGDPGLVSGGGKASQGGPDSRVRPGRLGQLGEPVQEPRIVSGLQQHVGEHRLSFGEVRIECHRIVQQFQGQFEVLVSQCGPGHRDQRGGVLGVALVKSVHELRLDDATIADGQDLQVQRVEVVLSADGDPRRDGFPAS